MEQQVFQGMDEVGSHTHPQLYIFSQSYFQVQSQEGKVFLKSIPPDPSSNAYVLSMHYRLQAITMPLLYHTLPCCLGKMFMM